MAALPQAKLVEPAVDQLRPAVRPQTSANWEMRLGLGQLIIIWSTIAGMMVLVFLFGLHAGQEEGRRAALEDHGGQVVRLPVVHPDGNAASIAAEPSEKEKALNEVLADLKPTGRDSAAQAAKVEKAGKTEKPAAGFATKSVAALTPPEPEVVKPAPKKSPAPIKETTLAEVAKKPAVVKTPPPVKEAPPKAVVKKPVVEPTPVAVKRTPAPSAVVPKGWYLQIMAARSRSEAESTRAKLEGAGLGTHVQKADVKGKLYYRVLVGPYSSRTAAQGKRTQVKNSGAARGTPFVKQIR